MVVYKHTNLMNQKVYIGITKYSNPQKRWKDGYGYMQNKIFFKDILKYGWNNFQHEIIAQNISIKTAQELEKFLINKYRSNNILYGYSQTSGGEYCYKCSKNIKKQKITFQEIPIDDKQLFVSDF